MTKVKIYESFHKTTTTQKRLIQDKNFTYRHILQILNKYITSSQKILDIGCGAGTLCLYYAHRGNAVVGIDISQTAINRAKKSASLLKLKKAKFEKMDFPNKTPQEQFDFIIFTEVIEHLENDELALNKIYKLLKKNGMAFISTPSRNAPLHRLGLAKNFDKEVGHLRRYTLKELEKKVKKSGFTIIETKKTEGIVRNFLFLNPIAGKSVRFIKFFLSDWVTFIDAISLKLFGESNIFLVIKKN